MDKSKSNRIRFAAIGDLLLTAKPNDSNPGRGLEALSDDIKTLFHSCDIVFANLECTLSGNNTIPTEPRVVSTQKQIRSLQNTGINVVTMGNNHAFDCLDIGFQKTSAVLKNMGLSWVGAGRNLEEAFEPVIMEIDQVKIAFLGIVDISSGPFRFADESVSGVAPLDIQKVCDIIRRLTPKVDHVVVSPHWGRERFRIPSIDQIHQAHAFVDAGASMVLGHHPHVLQGMEIYKKAPIVYSLGNFFANDVYWSDGDSLTWTRFERTGCIFVAELDSTGVFNVKQVPVIDDGQTIRIEQTGWGDTCISKVNHFLGKGVTPKKYKREKFLVETLKPILGHLRWSKLLKIRPSHFKKLIRLIFRKTSS